MNRVFKTKWSAAHQQYVVTDEHHATRQGLKSAVAFAVAAFMMAAGARLLMLNPVSRPRAVPPSPKLSVLRNG
ncbi:MAG: ESPR-type extended signal peptide-containing protein [Sutterella wadsworthensis]